MALTHKQKKFADAYIETGNKTQSALKAYDTTSPDVAAVIGIENLGKPKIREYIESKAENAAIRIVELSEQNENLNVALGASKDILDRAGYKPVEKSQSVNVNLDINYQPKDKKIADKYEEELRRGILGENFDSPVDSETRD